MSVKNIPVVDVFAGPGGLNEGFSRAGDKSAARFETALSIEMDAVACRTLRLRSVRRQLDGSAELARYFDYVAGRLSAIDFRASPVVARAFAKAEAEVLELELGPDNRAQARESISAALGDRQQEDWVLIGGPPCQAYSLAGRSRRANDGAFYEDKKHFLYREYLAILRDFAPAVFVMENVKGLLSSTHTETSMFDRIMSDLRSPSEAVKYELFSLATSSEKRLRPSDFVLRAERYGVPQKRHRVILVGVRTDLVQRGFVLPQLEESTLVTVGDAISDLPPLRSGLSPTSADSFDAWNSIRVKAAKRASVSLAHQELGRGAQFTPIEADDGGSVYSQWVQSRSLGGVLQHESRAHMRADLERYFHIAVSARGSGLSPKLRDLPEDLLPNHTNARSDGHAFEDRFRVQVATQPSTTVVSHISKDGHYYIHPDPDQMRSLTVREAARLQSFPDDYFFEGNRTQQYHQVGNAVPPLLAYQIGNAIAAGFASLATDLT